MDFLANIIKRPISMTSSGAQSTAMEVSKAVSTREAVSSRDTAESPDLSALLDSASDDLLLLEEQHILMVNPLPTAIEKTSPPNSNKETIQQLLSKINVNLNQVSAIEMEHLQAMSGELSPLVMKASPKPASMDQKAMAASLGHKTVATACFKLDVDATSKFGGIPEFDEMQIPELSPLSDEIEPKLIADQSCSDVFVECLSLHTDRYSGDRSELEAYSSALNEVLEQQISNTSTSTLENRSDDPLAVSKANVSYEPMDVDDINETMEMLKDVLGPEDHRMLQQQFLPETQTIFAGNPVPLNESAKLKRMEQSSVEQTSVTQSAFAVEKEESILEKKAVKEKESKKLHKTDQQNELVQEPPHEEKTVGEEQQQLKDLTENFEELPKSLCNRQLEQKQRPEELNAELCKEIKHSTPSTEKEKTPVNKQQQQIKKLLKMSQEHLHLESQPLPEHQQKSQDFLSKLCLEKDPSFGVDLSHEKEKEKYAKVKDSDMSPGLEPSFQFRPAASLSPPIPTYQPKKVELALSSPIPTQRPKSTEELQYMVLKELPLPDNKDAEDSAKNNVSKQETAIKEKADQYAHPLPLVSIKPTQVLSTTPISVEINAGHSAFPQGTISPNFPVRGPAELHSHFPRSPQGPPESEKMAYLEEAVVEPSGDCKQSNCGAGAIARSPMVIEVTQPSPEKPLNESLPMNEMSPISMNGSFDSSMRMKITPEEATHQGSATFAVSLDSAEEQQRRTLSVIMSTEEKVEATPRRTFCLEQEKDKPRRTFCVEPNASPAVEATEESMAGEEFEAMDVDISIRVDEVETLRPAGLTSPSIPTHQNLNRGSIHGEHNSRVPTLGNTTVVLEEQTLSAKEQATLSASDEKDDVFVQHFGAVSPVTDDMFKTPQFTSSGFQNQPKLKTNATGGLGVAMGRNKYSVAGGEEQFFDVEFQDSAGNQNLILNSSDFDYLYTKGSNNAPIDRSSLLLKFDPLLGAPVPVNHPHQQEQALLNILGSNQNQNRALSPTLEEHETSGANQLFGIVASAKETAKKLDYKPTVDRTKKHAKMSVDVIDNDCNKTFDNSNLNTEDKSHNYNNMDDLEKKIKNEVTRSEDIEKKLKEAEQREEALIKRITEKDKTNAKLNGVIEAYEKAIAELISEKEQLAQGYERQLQEVQTDRDANYHHLTSLESTFSDLHAKYEKSKQMTSQLKANEESLQGERKQLMDNLRMQEQRYDKMKNHAMQQLEIANKKLDTYTREHADEVKKLKALLKKEEVSRVSMTEQLQQKSRENADLLKICEELIYGKGQGGSS
ncbi:hypothetical protein KR009_010844 [Drosophila setifemur]|nr:hypothetical protein KR009_010844 [Drosophila setifemur]